MSSIENSGPPILMTRSGAVASIVLNRPAQGNAVTLELARGLLDAAICCDQDASIRCVTLTGAGRLFCAGGDVATIAGAGDSVGSVLSELAGTLHLAISRLARMPKPLLTLVNGPAAGAGMSLAILGDIVIATRSAHFTLAYGALGLTPDGGASWLLPRLIGLRRTQELILTNRRVSADEAEAIGLVTRTVDDSSFAIEGEAMAQTLGKSATSAIGAARELLLDSLGASLETQMEREARAISRAGTQPAGQEGLRAFIEKRRPEF